MPSKNPKDRFQSARGFQIDKAADRRRQTAEEKIEKAFRNDQEGYKIANTLIQFENLLLNGVGVEVYIMEKGTGRLETVPIRPPDVEEYQTLFKDAGISVTAVGSSPSAQNFVITNPDELAAFYERAKEVVKKIDREITPKLTKEQADELMNHPVVRIIRDLSSSELQKRAEGIRKCVQAQKAGNG